MNKENQDNQKPEDAKVVAEQSAEVKAEVVVEKPEAAKVVVEEKQKSYDSRKKKSGRPSRRPNSSEQSEAPEFMEKVISINRITKVTKGGKNLSFSALVVVGDMKGKVGYSLSKAKEVSIAIRKAMTIAKKNMMQVSLKGTSIPHEIIGRCSGSRVLLKPASEGTGVIASGPVRAVCDGAGIHNILTKVHRSNNPINVVKATMDGLSRLKKAKIDDVKTEEEVENDASS